ncbi:hypothetical protein POPTR_001G255904v4 [Populus trichocarpa]|uniref:Uncharacterized protein n=1 Tax=Populus trichocarpa TaxID=3694 RepID=A0ACC0TL92_POPTR|nr:hypothetical protein BDE02_01G230500 [Populus trichocarpa]KAI9402346.1 hypothetical protein POPTR_001G255904v4 [Populus trichocarpa]
MASMGSRSLDSGNAILSSRKHNKCVFLPADANMVAESLERRNQNWEFSPGKKNDTVGFRSSDYILEIRLMITAGNILVRIQL